MKINVETPNFAADVKLIDFLKRKLEKLEVFYDRIIYADAFLKVPGDDLVVKKQARTFEQGVDECVQALERQLKKRKEKLRAKAS